LAQRHTLLAALANQLVAAEKELAELNPGTAWAQAHFLRTHTARATHAGPQLPQQRRRLARPALSRSGLSASSLSVAPPPCPALLHACCLPQNTGSLQLSYADADAGARKQRVAPAGRGKSWEAATAGKPANQQAARRGVGALIRTAGHLVAWACNVREAVTACVGARGACSVHGRRPIRAERRRSSAPVPVRLNAALQLVRFAPQQLPSPRPTCLCARVQGPAAHVPGVRLLGFFIALPNGKLISIHASCPAWNEPAAVAFHREGGARLDGSPYEARARRRGSGPEAAQLAPRLKFFVS